MQQGMLFRRAVVGWLGGFNLRYRLCADLDFWLRAYVMNARFRFAGKRVAQFESAAASFPETTRFTEAEQDEIVQRHLPVPVAKWDQRIARWRYPLLEPAAIPRPNPGGAASRRATNCCTGRGDDRGTRRGGYPQRLRFAHWRIHRGGAGVGARSRRARVTVTLFTCVGPVDPRLRDVPNLR